MIRTLLLILGARLQLDYCLVLILKNTLHLNKFLLVSLGLLSPALLQLLTFRI